MVMDLLSVRDQVTSAFLDGRDYVQVQKDEYTDFRYPKIIPMMRFHVDRYRIPGFGSFMTMHTKTSFGMQLLTMSFMAGSSGYTPYCLIDIMTVGKKRTVFVEYYDCGNTRDPDPALASVYSEYSGLSDYAEKPHWYVGERTPYSLIKCGTKDDDAALEKMVLDSVRAYRTASAVCDLPDMPGLKAFRERMINEGNPSSSVLEKVFGKEGARDFFLKCVMPVDE